MFASLKTYGAKVAIITVAISGTLGLVGYAVTTAVESKAMFDEYIHERAELTFKSIEVAANIKAQERQKHVDDRMDAMNATINQTASDARVTKQEVKGNATRLNDISNQINTLIQMQINK